MRNRLVDSGEKALVWTQINYGNVTLKTYVPLLFLKRILVPGFSWSCAREVTYNAPPYRDCLSPLARNSREPNTSTSEPTSCIISKLGCKVQVIAMWWGHSPLDWVPCFEWRCCCHGNSQGSWLCSQFQHRAQNWNQSSWFSKMEAYGWSHDNP